MASSAASVWRRSPTARRTRHDVIARSVAPGTHIVSDGWPCYDNPPANSQEARVVTGRKAHELLVWVHRVFSNLKRWTKGVFYGLRKIHVQRYLDKLLFRWNRCHHMRHVFKRLPGIGMGLVPPPIAIKSISAPNCMAR